MPRALSNALRAIIKADLEANLPIKEIMVKHRISQQKASNMYNLYHQTGEVWLPSTKKPHGRPKKIQPAHEERLRAFLAEHPDASLSNMCDFLAAECGVDISENGVWRYCNDLGHTCKRPPRQRDGLSSCTRTLPRDENGRPIRPSRSTSEHTKRKKKAPGDRPGWARTTKLLEKTRNWVKEHISSNERFDAGHDWAHVERVVALSMEILRVEEQTWKAKGVKFDALVVELVALMHDIDEHRFAPGASSQPADEVDAAIFSVTQDQDQDQNQSQTQSYPSPDSTMDPSSLDPSTSNPNTSPIDPSLQLPTSPPSLVHTTLTHLGWPPTLSSHISHLTSSIPYTTEHSPLSAVKTLHTHSLGLYPEHAIVQDAVRLDMLGAIGISRAVASRGMDAGMAFLRERVGRVEKGMKTGEGGRKVEGRAGVVRWFMEAWEGEMRTVGGAVPTGKGALVKRVGEDGVERLGRWVQGVFVVEGGGEEGGTGDGRVEGEEAEEQGDGDEGIGVGDGMEEG